MKQEIRFGVIGTGMMGREFAAALSRWMELLDVDYTPRIAGVAGTNPAGVEWFRSSLPGLQYAVSDYRELLDQADIDVIYCATPHHLHAEMYTAIIQSGKHLLGEKPFGIDLEANRRILAALQANPQVFARCTSQFTYFPGAQMLTRFLQEGRFGRIIEVQAGFLHSSDLDPRKAINWKRQVQFCGEYGCMGDLGMHILHIPLRYGLVPSRVHALLSKIIPQRPDRNGNLVPCDTWDNAVLACEVDGAAGTFPMLLSFKRIEPGEVNTWFLRITGTQFSAEFSTKQPRTLRTLAYESGKPQAWEVRDLGSASAYPTISGANFEFGAGDAFLQMCAAFCDELVHGKDMRQPFSCATPEETRLQHELFTAALQSQRGQIVARL
jgi:predicted dehydrogenase